MAWIRWYEGPRGKVARIQWRDPKSGRIGTRTLGVVGEETARIALADVAARMEGRGPTLASASSTAALGRFLGALAVQRLRANTIDFYRATLTPILAHFGSTPMRLWNRGMLESYIATNAATEDRPGGWSPRTIQIRVNACKRFIAWCKAACVECGDFVAGYKGPKCSVPPRLHYTADEVGRLLDVAGAPGRRPFVQPMIALCALAGASSGDLYRLTWGEVNLETGWLRSRRSKTGQAWVVKMPAQLVEALRPIRAVSGPVLRDLPPTPQALTGVFGRVAHAAGLSSEGGLKRLRHSYCTLLGVGLDVDLATGQAAMGHARGSSATLRYMHTTEAGLAGAARVIEEKIRAVR